MGTLLRNIRLRERLTQEELARKAGVPVSSLMELEKESGGITTAGVLRRVAFALGKTVEEIFLP